MYPDFIGIGAQKAGTTWLHRNLRAHPQIFMPRKEVHYFDRKINDRSGVAGRLFGEREAHAQWRRQVKRVPGQLLKDFSTRDLLWNYRYYMKPYDDRWYASVFDGKDGRVAGEITPAYSALDRDRIAHVHALMPEARVVFFVRNPVERAWSHAIMSFDKVEKGSASSVSEEELLRKVGREGTRRLSDYSRTLENWGSFYPEERIFVGFLEDVRFFPRELLGRLYGFLGVDPSFEPPMPARKVHTRSAGTIPTAVAVRLAHDFGPETARLAERFGGYASFWSYCARRLTGAVPEVEHVPYPFWEWSAWEEWVGGAETGRPRFQSGPLPSVLAR